MNSVFELSSVTKYNAAISDIRMFYTDIVLTFNPLGFIDILPWTVEEGGKELHQKDQVLLFNLVLVMI